MSHPSSESSATSAEQLQSADRLCALIDGLAAAVSTVEDINHLTLLAFEQADAWKDLAALREDRLGGHAVAAALEEFEEAAGEGAWAPQLLASAVRIAVSPRGARAQMRNARDEKEYLLEDVLGLGSPLARAYIVNSDLRHHKREQGTQRLLAPVDRGAGILIEIWARDMARFMENVTLLGPQRTQALYQQCGISNFDRYDYYQLERMARFIEGDEELLEELRNGDVTLVIGEGFDENDAVGQQIPAYENDTGTTLYFEAEHPLGVYRALLALKKAGVPPSTLVLISHGLADRLGFGSGVDKYDLKLLPQIDEKLARKKAGIKKEDEPYDLQKAQIARVVTELMQPAKSGQWEGWRSLVLSSCLQILLSSRLKVTVAEAVTLQTPPEAKVIVSASDRGITAERREAAPQEDKVVFHDIVKDQQVPAHTLVHLGSGVLERATRETVPGTP